MTDRSGSQTLKLSNLDIASWSKVIMSAFFPVDVTPRASETFVGNIRMWSPGGSTLAHVASSPARYLRRQVPRTGPDPFFTVNFFVDSRLRFFGEGAEKRFNPGQFMLYPATRHWSWDQETDGELWTLRLPLQPLRRRLGDIGKFEHYSFDLTRGAGRTLFEMVRLIASQADEASPATMRVLHLALIDMLAVALEEHEQVLGGGTSATRQAHLSRIESYLHDQLDDAGLCPGKIAKACGISTRYLHDLFRSNGRSLGQWILEQRLQGACRELHNAAHRQTIAQVALAWGFADHAHFSRCFKARFGHSPRDIASEPTAFS